MKMKHFYKPSYQFFIIMQINVSREKKHAGIREVRGYLFLIIGSKRTLLILIFIFPFLKID